MGYKQIQFSIALCSIAASVLVPTTASNGRPIYAVSYNPTLDVTGERLGHRCYAGDSDLGADYEAALSKLPSTTARLVIGYPAISDENDLGLINRRVQTPVPLQKDSKNNQNANWYAQQELIRSPYFAAILYKSVKVALGKRGNVLLQPLYATALDDGAGFDFAWAPADQGLMHTAMSLVNTRVYSFGVTARTAIEDQRHEALTMGHYLTPAVAVSQQSSLRGQTVNIKPIVISRLGTSRITNLPTWSGGIPKSSALYASTRIKLNGDAWTTYLNKPATSANPAQSQWADALAKKLVGVQTKLTTPTDMAALGKSWALSMFGACAADVAHRFRPDAWARITGAALNAENQALAQWSDALYVQLTDGTYGTAFRSQMSRETDAIQRYEHARAAQGFANFMSVFTAVTTGAMSGYANRSSGGYNINNLQLSDQMFDYSMIYQSGTQARDSARSSSLSALSELANATAAPQLQAVTIVGADQQTITVHNFSELRLTSVNLILDMSARQR